MALTKIKLDSMVTGNLPDANIPNNITITNAGTATALENARTINGTSFDGSANITVTSAAGTLTGNTLASGITASSLTSVGSLTGLTIAGTGTNAAPTLAIDNSSSSSYIHSIEALGANMTQGQNNIINLGKIGSTKNSAVIGYKWDSAGSDNNLLTFEHWGTGPLVTIDGAGDTAFSGKVSMGDAGLTSADEFPVNIDINSSTTQQCGLEVRQHTSGNDNRMRFKNANGQYVRFGQSSNGDFFLEPFNSGYNKVFTVKTTGMTRIEGKDSGSRTTGDDNSRTLSLGGRPDSNNYVTLGFDSGNTYRAALDFKADSGDFSYWVNSSGSWLQSFSINNGRDISTFGVIMADQSGTSDYSNTALKTIDGNDHNGVRIKHGGGNGQIAIYGGNQDRTRIKPNQIEANVNGLEIKTTDAQSLTLGTNNTTRLLIGGSTGSFDFYGDISRINRTNNTHTNVMKCFHFDHPGTDSTSFFDFSPVEVLGLPQAGGSFFLKISGWMLDRFFGLVTYRNNGGSGDINSGADSLDTIVNDGFSVGISRPSGNLIRIQLSGQHNNNHGWDMMVYSAPNVT